MEIVIVMLSVPFSPVIGMISSTIVTVIVIGRDGDASQPATRPERLGLTNSEGCS